LGDKKRPFSFLQTPAQPGRISLRYLGDQCIDLLRKISEFSTGRDFSWIDMDKDAGETNSSWIKKIADMAFNFSLSFPLDPIRN